MFPRATEQKDLLKATHLVRDVPGLSLEKPPMGASVWGMGSVVLGLSFISCVPLGKSRCLSEPLSGFFSIERAFYTHSSV